MIGPIRVSPNGRVQNPCAREHGAIEKLVVGVVLMCHSLYTLPILTMFFVLTGCRATRNPPPLPPSGVSRPPSATAETPPASPEPIGRITLREAASLALMHNPRLGAISIERRAAEARRLQASLRPNPELDVELESLGGSGERSSFDAAEITISLGQLIELRGKRDKRIRVASLETEMAQWDFESQRLDTLRDVTLAFVAVLAAQERLALAEQLRDLSGEAQSAVAQRVEAGKDSAVENLRADVAFSMRRIEFQKASGALTAARHNLAAVWGARAASFEEAAGDFYAVTPAPSALDADEVIAANPDLVRWAIEQRQRQAALDLERAKATSDITVAAGVQHFRESDDSAFMVGLALPIPLFDRNQGGIEEATANLAKARKQHQAAEIEIAAMLAEAVNGLAAAYEEVQILRTDVLPRAQQAFEAAQQGYREGKFDYLYVLDTQRTFFETKVQYIDAVEACHRARADVERLTGRPLDPSRADDERQSKGAEQ